MPQEQEGFATVSVRTRTVANPDEGRKLQEGPRLHDLSVTRERARGRHPQVQRYSGTVDDLTQDGCQGPVPIRTEILTSGLLPGDPCPDVSTFDPPRVVTSCFST